jgi:hypothetical protein
MAAIPSEVVQWLEEMELTGKRVRTVKLMFSRDTGWTHERLYIVEFTDGTTTEASIERFATNNT